MTRPTFVNNRRLEGRDYFRIMAATGHKTMSVFKRYNTVSRGALKALVGENPGANDTYNDTYKKSATKKGQAFGA